MVRLTPFWTGGLGLIAGMLTGPWPVAAGVTAGQPVPVFIGPPPAPQPGGPPGLPPGVAGAGLPARDQPGKTGTSRIKGRIVAADTGQPLRRATVRAMAPELRESVSTTTGADGQYEFKDLPAGRYSVSASKGAYAQLSFGQTRASEGGRPIEVGENQTIDRIDLRLPRGGVVTGVILDEFGEPVPDASVTPLRQQYVNGQRRLMPVGRSAMSNDIGGYRLFGLAPGSYYLSVSSRSVIAMMNTRNEDRSGYAPTYYPNTSDVGSAQRLTVGAGQTMADVNITLVPTQTAEVSGTVVDPSGQRVRAGVVLAMPRAAMMLPGPPTVGMIRPDGTFTIGGVAPGEYLLRASMPPDAAGGAPMLAATATVTVGGQDVTGVQLVPAVPGTVRGRVTLDGGTVTAAGGAPLQLVFSPISPEDAMLGMMAGVGPATVRDDLTFESRAAAGKMVARLLSDGRWSLKAVRHQGVDATDTGLDIRSGADVDDVEIELTSRKQEVSGLVTAAGKPTTQYTAIVFAQDRERWTAGTRHIAVGRPDQEGRFRVRTLPPGDYYAVAVASVEPGAWMDPDFLDSVRHAAVSVSLHEGETRTVDLRLAEPR